LDFTESNSSQGKQAFFDALIQQQMQIAEQSMMIGMDLDLHIRDLQKPVDYPPESYEVVINLRMHAYMAVLYALEHVIPVLPNYLQKRIVQLLAMRSQIWGKKPGQAEKQ
jgi:hypothetical protein